MSLKSLILTALERGDACQQAALALREGAKRVSYPRYEAMCIAAIVEKYSTEDHVIVLNDDGTLPKSEQAAYQRLKRLRRAHPDFVPGKSSGAKAELPRGCAAKFQAHVLALGLTKAQLRVLFTETLKGLE
jgi:hypothetical protein